MKVEFFSAIFSPLQSALQPWITQASEAFGRLSRRDQIALLMLMVFLVGFMLYAFVWGPLNAGLEKAKKQYQAEQATLAWMQSQQASVIAARKNPNKPRVDANVSLLTLVNNEARRASLSLKRYEPEGNHKLRVWLEDVPFDTVILWINRLSVDKGLTVSSATVDAEQGRGGQTKSGYVNVKVVFEK